jgi:predicted secreted protein
MLIAGCGGGASDRDIEISCDDFYEETFITDSLTIDSGEQITIKLCSNPSTGFEWSDMPENTHPEVLSQDNHDFAIQGDNSKPLPPGTPGMEIWTFKALEKGQTQLFFEYSRNWEGGEKGAWTYTLNVTVQ